MTSPALARHAKFDSTFFSSEQTHFRSALMVKQWTSGGRMGDLFYMEKKEGE